MTHGKSPKGQSHFEVLEDGITRTDFATAHDRVGDTDRERFIPDRCKVCYKQEVEAEEAGWPYPTKPDEEVDWDDSTA